MEPPLLEVPPELVFPPEDVAPPELEFPPLLEEPPEELVPPLPFSPPFDAPQPWTPTHSRPTSKPVVPEARTRCFIADTLFERMGCMVWQSQDEMKSGPTFCFRLPVIRYRAVTEGMGR